MKSEFINIVVWDNISFELTVVCGVVSIVENISGLSRGLTLVLSCPFELAPPILASNDCFVGGNSLGDSARIIVVSF